MPRTKTDTTAPSKAKTAKPKEEAPPPAKSTVTVSLEVTPEQYAQAERIAQSWGYTVDEWLRETVEGAL